MIILLVHLKLQFPSFISFNVTVGGGNLRVMSTNFDVTYSVSFVRNFH